MRMRVRLAAAYGVLLAACGGGPAVTVPDPFPTPTPTPEPRYPVIVAAGDIACGISLGSSGCRQSDTALRVLEAEPDLILALGDLQYESGAYADFVNFYDASWGRFKDKTRPVPGNHEYVTPNAQGYFDYFNGLSAASGVAGDRDKGYYSFDLGDWHLIALNSNCPQVKGCGRGSPQELWLRADLAAHRRLCTLAYWHHPRFSSGTNGNHLQAESLWTDLYEAGADVVLNGHDHDYERFAAQTPLGVADPDRGIRQFVVGTGGRNLTRFVSDQPNSEVRDATSFGILRIRLRPNTYDWDFVPISGQTFTDRGVGVCH